jgi:nicotinamidase/pyrazinamidase
VTEYDRLAALIVVDVQNDFADPDGSLYVRGGEEVVPFVNEQIERATEGGATIVYTQDWHPETTPHFQKDGGIWPVHCVADTWGARFHPALHVMDGASILRKGTDGKDGYSAFSVRDPTSGEVESTRLDGQLRDAVAERLVVLGLATDYCVKETVLDARRLGFATVVLTGGIGAVDLEPGDGDRAIEAMRDAGAVLE